MRKLSLIALALMACGTASAAVVGNVAEVSSSTTGSGGNVASVSAPLTIGAQNVTNATWIPAVVSGPKIPQFQKLGTLNIQASGTHAGVYITGEGTTVAGGVVTVPFYDAKGVPHFRGRTDASIPGYKIVPVTGHNGPGWKVMNTGNNINVDIKNAFMERNVPAGTYTATFYIQQYQN